MTEIERKIIDETMSRIADEIGEERLNEISVAVYKEVYGKEPVEVRVDECPYGPYCGVSCHVLGFNCKYKPCAT